MTGAYKGSSHRTYPGIRKTNTTNGEKLEIIRINNLHLPTTDSLSQLPNVSLVPKLARNLISIGQLINQKESYIRQ